jgi:hypothetical protein
MSIVGKLETGRVRCVQEAVNFLSAAYSELRATTKTTAMLLAGPLVRL